MRKTKNVSESGYCRALCAGALLVFGCLSNAYAVDIDGAVSGTVSATDNVTRVGVGELDEIVSTVSLVFQLSEMTPRLQAQVTGDLSYQDYYHDTFDGESINFLNAFGSYSFIPQRFVWTATNNSGQQIVNPLEARNPGNRQDINIFSTGPDISLPLGSERTLLRIGARYENTGFETSNADNDRVSVNLALVRQISRDTSLGLQITDSSIEFDSDVTGRNFDRRQYFVRYTRASERTDLSIDAGFNEVDIDGQQSSDGELFRVNFTRLLSASSSIQFSAARTISDTSDLFRLFQGTASDINLVGDFQVTGDPFTSDSLTLSFTNNRPRTALRVTATSFTEEFETQTLLDRDRLSFNVDLSRRLSNLLRAAIELDFTERDFTALNRVDRNTSATFRLAGNVGRTAGVEIGVQYTDRDSTQVGVDANETRYFLSFRYGLFGRREFRGLDDIAEF